MVLEAVQEDTGEGSMQCNNHPYKTTTPGGGICAFCLQEKLGKLVSSSLPTAVFPSSSSPSPSPSFRSDFKNPTKSTNITHNPNTNSGCHYHQFHSTRAFHRIPFLHTHKRNKNRDLALPSAVSKQGSVVFNRSKSTSTSTTTPRRFSVAAADDYTPRKRGFWSLLLHLSKNSSSRKIDRHCKAEISTSGSFAAADESETADAAAAAAFDRKVSRSRSVGCGSRSFSGDFFERISTGFGDCTLRRVESQREGKHKVTAAHRRRGSGCGGGEYIRERVKCGGIFGGFLVTSSSSSSSSSSCLVSSSAEDSNGKPPPPAHGRSKSWGWAFASPIRALSKPSSSTFGKRESSVSNNKNTTTTTTATPNLNAILAVRG